ncbi:hypothetical protein TSUD_19890 [Trifolium subterraneum]|uniref:Uncharacterized protein n=1 Tax=Trifolium subterraneum TaxID=3900 RepID=A0A2Z6MUX8_TRISU|nr:hypothetical protein TSUD_19890 [Trifolium subterraneum]
MATPVPNFEGEINNGNNGANSALVCPRCNFHFRYEFPFSPNVEGMLPRLAPPTPVISNPIYVDPSCQFSLGSQSTTSNVGERQGPLRPKVHITPISTSGEISTALSLAPPRSSSLDLNLELTLAPPISSSMELNLDLTL